MGRAYDLVVVGSGIAGAMVAFYAKKFGLYVLILDRSQVAASGGSGAAGAFIAPKLGKDTPLVNLTNLSFKYATNFYKKYFLDYFDNRGIVRLPKDKLDEQNLSFYQQIIGAKSKILNPSELKSFGLNCNLKGLYFKDGGVLDAQAICKALVKDIEFSNIEVNSLEQKDGYILINNSILAKKVVLATGYEGFSGLEYMGIKGLWGSRGDYYTNSDIKVCVHKNISISAKLNGVIKIGATHIRAKEPCKICNGKPLEKLEIEAKNMANLEDLKLKEIFCGYRSTSKDYFPLIGRVIDTNFMLQHYPQIKKGFSKAPLKYIDNLYVFNGLGGRGFVFAPLMAKWLVEFIYKKESLNSIVNPDRLFLKWARRLK